MHNHRKQKKTTTFIMVGTRRGKKKDKVKEGTYHHPRGRTNKPPTELQRGSKGRGKAE
jgi:hypothetical protein